MPPFVLFPLIKSTLWWHPPCLFVDTVNYMCSFVLSFISGKTVNTNQYYIQQYFRYQVFLCSLSKAVHIPVKYFLPMLHLNNLFQSRIFSILLILLLIPKLPLNLFVVSCAKMVFSKEIIKYMWRTILEEVKHSFSFGNDNLFLGSWSSYISKIFG